MPDETDQFDVVVVGAGPGGMAAATTLAEAGRRVALVDDAPSPGGQIWRNRGEMPKARQARHWFDRYHKASAAISRFSQSRVVATPSRQTLLIETPVGPRQLGYQSLVLAVGARELFLPFPGWTLPGVVGAGGIQALVKQGLPVRGKRIVVAGSGPLLLAVADLLNACGAIVPMILEQTPATKLNRFGISLWRSPSKLFQGLTIRGRLRKTAYATDSFVTGVTRRRDGTLCTEFRRKNRVGQIECDYLACGFGLLPNNEVPQLIGCAIDDKGFVPVDERMQTSRQDIYAVGEVTGVGGVDKAILEGQIAAYAILGNDAKRKKLSNAYARSAAFVRLLETAFSLRPELYSLARPDTVVCRCEDVRLATVQTAISGRDAKLQSRCGMGVCQGRVCGPILSRLISAEAPQIRPPVSVTTIATLMAAGGSSGEEIAS